METNYLNYLRNKMIYNLYILATCSASCQYGQFGFSLILLILFQLFALFWKPPKWSGSIKTLCWVSYICWEKHFCHDFLSIINHLNHMTQARLDENLSKIFSMCINSCKWWWLHITYQRHLILAAFTYSKLFYMLNKVTFSLCA